MTTPISAFRAFLALSSSILPVTAHAQDATQLPPVEVDSDKGADAIVTAPVTGRELTRDDLRRRQNSTSDTADLLRQLPGVSANAGGGFSSMPAIRGLSEQRLNITVDGHPIDMACPNDMNSPLSYTNPQLIQSIKVVPGVAPVSMGGDNIGGVIAVESAAPRFAIGPGGLATGEASAFYRTNGNGFGGSAQLTLANERLSATYTGSYTQADQYQGGSNRGLVRSSEYAKTDHALALALQSQVGLFRLKGGYHFSPYEGFPNQAMDMVSNKSWFLNAGYDGEFDWGSVKFTADYRDTDHEMNFLEDKLPGSMPMVTEVHTFSTALKLDLPVSPRDTLRVGGEYHHQWLNDYWPPVTGNMMMGPNTFVNINAAHRNRLGAFAEWEAHWSDRLSSVVGVRLDRVSMNAGIVQPYSTSMMNMDDAMAAAAFNAASHARRDNNWNASALVSYAPADGVAIELGYAHKTRSPNLYERFSWGRGAMSSRMIGWYGDGNGYVGNLNLKPERADTVSAAAEFKGADDAWSLRIAPYYTHVNDYIDATFVRNLTTMMGMPTPWVQLQFANQKAEFYGVDLSGRVALGRGENANGTDLTGSLTYVHGQNLSGGRALYHQMPLDVKLGIQHRQGKLEASLEAEWVAEKTRVDLTRNEPRTNDYALVNLRFAYDLGIVRVSVDAENLFDTGYDLPLGGISLGDYKANGVRRAVPGRGRSVNFGISASF
ncbi:TonB-dependent receptor [Novosphingobium sp. ERN07]|uniref:TonB-dependent receptor plug domain-containing protein n=1 Tax=Novosphingobium sp. ERN07 TaxID=2726187 RepID=UPI001456F209|nr:TonB-dependent receptor [Novosphingobium sp. ERN07]NLR72066.1 TonB-dependent receptor [Novosphingobium sp. ERN07]